MVSPSHVMTALPKVPGRFPRGKPMHARFLVLSLLAASLAGPAASAAEYDVVVYGGTSGGVAAAVQAARMGKSVVLVEPGKHLGGLSSGGLGWTDSGNKEVVGG